MSKATTWQSLRRRALERGQITEEGVQEARVAQDAYEAGFKLAQLRKQTGLTQQAVAARMGVTQPRVSAMERGELDQLTVATVRDYVAALGGGMHIVASVDDTAFELRLPTATLG